PSPGWRRETSLDRSAASRATGRKNNGLGEATGGACAWIAFGARVVPERAGVRVELWVSNGSAEKLTGLQVQMCVMLKGLTGFEERTNDNKVFAKPLAACRARGGKRWVITGWEPCVRAWGNPPCPCLHSDPQVPDCLPGETKRVRGWLSFFEGDDIDA